MNNFSDVVVTSQRLLLRPIQIADAAAWFAIRSNAVVMRYGASLPWEEIDIAHEKIAHDLTKMSLGEYSRWAIVRRSDNQFIGTCGLFHFDEQCRRAEIGYELHPDVWGNGYMHEALQAIVNYGFIELGLNRIEADIHPDNQASAKVLDRLGFKKEGLLREYWIIDGEKSDSAFYGLLRHEWDIKQ